MGHGTNFCQDNTLHYSDQLLQASDKSLPTLIICNFSDFIHVCGQILINSSVVNFTKKFVYL